MQLSRAARTRRNASRRGALRIVDSLTLVAIGVVVLLVSLPRLRDFALRENEGDARVLCERLGRMAQASAASTPSSVKALVEADPALAKQLDDLEYLEDGALLRRHGYLFELLGGPESSAAGARVRAWPWSHRRTGNAAFAWTADLHLLSDDNRDGAWSGLEARPIVDGEHWRELSALSADAGS